MSSTLAALDAVPRRPSELGKLPRHSSGEAGDEPSSVEFVKTVAEFHTAIARTHIDYSRSLQSLVETFKEKTLLAKERWKECTNLFTVWENVLHAYGSAAQDHSDLGEAIEASVTDQLVESAKYKQQLVKMLDVYHDDYLKQSESLDAIIDKSEKEYIESWSKMSKDGMNSKKNHNTAFCYNRLNDYVLQLTTANQFNVSLSTAVLPKVNSDADLIRHEISESGISGLSWHSKILISKLSDQIRKLEVISKRSASEKPKGNPESFEAKQYSFSKPQPTAGGDFALNKLVLNSATEGVLKEKYDSLAKEIQTLETEINVVKDQTNRLKRQYESIKSNQSSKAHETLLEIHKLRNGNRQNETNLACKRAQLLLFSPDWFKTRLSNGHTVMASPERRASESGDSIREMGVSSNGSINSKSHVFQEYNFIKPTFCDDCKGMLKGIMRQGLRCKVCKANVHHRCMESVSSCSGPATPDKRKMLRRQKSTTDLDTRSLSDMKGAIREEPVDPIYQTIKCAAKLTGSTTDMSSRRGSVTSMMSSVSPKGTPSKMKPQQAASPVNSEGNFLLAPDSPSRRSGTPKSAPHSPNQAGEESRRKILQSYGKSMSFDTEPSHKPSTNGRKSEPPTPVENTPPRHCSSASDVMNVRFPSTLPSRQKYSGRIISSSVKSCKDASTSPAPGREYICLYDFEGMLRDDLSLKAGQRVRVAEDEGSDWWKGDCDGRFGYFPAFCVTFLQPWERVMVVMHSFKASHEKEDGLTLRKGQVVIQMSPEDNGWSQVRTGRKSGFFPYQYLEMFGKQKG
ncbi:uncharacterized protein LOC105446150 [Strongylocentrotus purpuratus]|uniref:Uncharacterized protein n=2 Tax=Strongylocentrotus purpuratus TaxID=7668 RepID=A0A7M7HNJ5_STRPU|nr:uncharacterized protein LOC105446150 [Strongylocentrotus purpuratus]|eukprot:XP_011680885.1 PREDICTED: uncharacterized protein LOC105446150 isoform X2 [Strongylocentrotus purpuratus]